MAKDKKDQVEEPQAAAGETPVDAENDTDGLPVDTDELVVVQVLRAITYGGIPMRPIVDGNKLTPIRAVIPGALAESYGPRYVKVIGLAEEGSRIGPVT